MIQCSRIITSCCSNAVNSLFIDPT
uniref:Uncharacterized protein n=1 Tax=Anguilla anguilla TaxID=7936 RepID=A0A0E9PYZ4_ANGAN